jgi:xylulokinase
VHLGIDIGTSAVKALVMDDAGRPVAEAAAPLTVSRPRPLWSEQDPEDWWHATLAATRALPAGVRAKVRAIGLSGQMHGAVALDAADRPLRPAILWNDGRSGAQCKTLEARAPGLRAIAGNAAMAGFTAPKLLWMAEHEPDLFAAIRTVLLPKDHVRLRLTGEKVSDMSDAAGTLWLDVAARDWSDALLAATNLDRSHMPRLVEGCAVSGRLTATAAAALGVPVVPVAGGAGDNAASAIGMGVIAPGRGFLSLGTSGVLFVSDDAFAPAPEKGVHAFCHAAPGRWHRMAVILSAASTLDWLAGVTGGIGVAELLAEIGPPRDDDPIFLPHLSGVRTPHDDPTATGAFVGLTHATTRGAMARATLEGVAMAMAEGFDALGRPALDDLALVGGGARASIWGSLLASVLETSVTRRDAGPSGAALGAARLARVAVDGLDVETACPPPALLETIAPDPALVDRFRARRPRFDRLHPALKAALSETPT